MTRINTSKVLLGGLVATVVLFVSALGLMLVTGEEGREAVEAISTRGRNPGMLVSYLAMMFVTGFLSVWLYAAIRPRFGPGPRTALLAGLVVWVLRPGLAIVNFLLMGLMPTDLLLTELFWNLGAICIATLLGARFYSEAETA
jgi:hypothetical protein